MRRFPVVMGATVAGLAGVLTFHSQSTAHALAAGSLPVAGGTPTTAPPTTAPPTTAPPTTAPPTTAPPTTAPPQATQSTQAAPVTASATGASEQYGYGVLAVKVTVIGSKITNTQVVGLQTAESYSQQIADQAIPYLRSQALAAQSANINGISGATYTSEAYATSLQSALNKLHVK